jgi:hypothetical protein
MTLQEYEELLTPLNPADWLLVNGPMRDYSGEDSIIMTIKELRRRFNISLKEAKDICDSSGLFTSLPF